MILAFGYFCTAGQDLGSSNKLFGPPETSPPKKTTIKKAPKRFATKTKPGPIRRRTTARSPAVDAKKALDQASARLSPKSEERDVPVSAAAAALYEKLIEDGNRARDERNYSAAETAYARAQAIKPKDARAVQGLGSIYSDQQRWDDAEAAYRTVLELEPRNAVIHIALSYVLSQQILIDNLAGRYMEPERLARRAIELAPSSALAFDQLGVSMELRGLIGPDTEGAYRSAIRLAPTFAPPYAHLGRLLRRRGLLKESAAAYETAVRYSVNVPTMILVAEVMQSEQRFTDSEPLLRKAIEGDHRNPAALILLARALIATGKFEESEQILRRSLDITPNSFMANLTLGSLYTRRARYEQAEAALLQALRSVPRSEKRSLSAQFESVGDGYMKTGKARHAERAYRQALALDPEDDSLADKLARAQR